MVVVLDVRLVLDRQWVEPTHMLGRGTHRAIITDSPLAYRRGR
jgi:hypothetical protein